MTEQELINFKQLLRVPTKSHREGQMVEFLSNYLNNMDGVEHYRDEHGNIYATKGQAEYYPCVGAHTDTVHQLDIINVYESDDNILYALNDEGKKTGIGGDDKCGIFLCLQMLEYFDNIKASFFVTEEPGAIGARNCDHSFFGNVGWFMEFDAPNHGWISFSCGGVQLFNPNGEFFESIKPILTEYSEHNRASAHPYTDVMQIASKFNFECINISAGYDNMHTPNEIIRLDSMDINKDTAIDIINTLGEHQYFRENGNNTMCDIVLSEEREVELIREKQERKKAEILNSLF